MVPRSPDLKVLMFESFETSMKVSKCGRVQEDPTLTDQRMQTLGNEYLTTSVEFLCGKVCKNPHGLKFEMHVDDARVTVLRNYAG